MKDASQNALVAAKLLHTDTRKAFVEQLKEEQQALRESSGKAAPTGQTVSMQEAGQRKLNLF
jgi:5-methyltetrahydrofolate--homocysteine methyltransferase